MSTEYFGPVLNPTINTSAVDTNKGIADCLARSQELLASLAKSKAAGLESGILGRLQGLAAELKSKGPALASEIDGKIKATMERAIKAAEGLVPEVESKVDGLASEIKGKIVPEIEGKIKAAEGLASEVVSKWHGIASEIEIDGEIKAASLVQSSPIDLSLLKDPHYLPWALEILGEAIILIQKGGIHWENLVVQLLARGSAIDPSMTLGSDAGTTS